MSPKTTEDLTMQVYRPSAGPARGTLASLLAAGLLIGASAASSDAANRDTIRFGLAIPFTVTDGGFFALGEEMGFFEEEGITVEPITLQGAGSVVPQVAQKNITIGQPLAETVLAAYQPDEAELPVVFFYNAIPANTLELAVLESSDIHSIADLNGGQVGVGALTWGTIPQTRALLRNVGLTPGEDVEIVAVGILGSGFHALREGRVDALNYNHTWIDLLEQSGTPARRLEYPPVYNRMVNNPFLTHRDTLRDQPDLLERFGRAYTKSVLACDANPAACVESFWRMNPESRPDGDAEAVLQNSIKILQRRLDLIVRDNDGQPRRHGAFDLEFIGDYVAELHRHGEFATDDIPLDSFFSNALVDAMNDFDAEAVAEAARALQ